MRRVAMIAVLFLLFSSCFYKPRYVESPPGSRGGTQRCREVSRVGCHTVNCGANRELGTVRCSGRTGGGCEGKVGWRWR